MIRRSDQDEYYERLVEDANAKVVQKLNDDKLKIGDEDIIIISGFLREGINLAHTGDVGFCKTCEQLNLKVISLPKRDRDKEDEIKKFMRRR